MQSVRSLEELKNLAEKYDLEMSQKELEAYWVRMGRGYKFYIEQLRDGQKYHYVARGKRESMRKYGAVIFSNFQFSFEIQLTYLTSSTILPCITLSILF